MRLWVLVGMTHLYGILYPELIGIFKTQQEAEKYEETVKDSYLHINLCSQEIKNVIS